jgi:hypothetical protein
LEAQWITHILAKIRISLPVPALPHPTVLTSGAQEAVALPIRLVVTSVMSHIPFVGSNPSRFLAWMVHPKLYVLGKKSFV